MKKTIFLLSFLSSTCLFAQEQTTSKPVRPWTGFTINPYLGVGVASTTFRIPNATEYDPSAGGSAILGVAVGYNLNSHVSFNVGIASSAYIWQIPFPGTVVDRAVSTNSFYTVPLTVKVATSKWNKVGFLVEGGFHLNFLNTIEERVEYTDGTVDKSKDKSYNNTFLPSFNLCMGLRIPLSKSTWMDVALDENFFLKDQYTSDAGKIYSSGLRIGIQTKLTK